MLSRSLLSTGLHVEYLQERFSVLEKAHLSPLSLRLLRRRNIYHRIHRHDAAVPASTKLIESTMVKYDDYDWDEVRAVVVSIHRYLHSYELVNQSTSHVRYAINTMYNNLLNTNNTAPARSPSSRRSPRLQQTVMGCRQGTQGV